MPDVIILAGLPGSGKTEYRKNNLDMPGIDIASIYQHHRERWPDFPITWQMAHAKLRSKALELAKQHDSIWVEAIFSEGSPSLRGFVRVMENNGLECRVVRMEASIDECQARVEADLQEGRVSETESTIRKEILNAYQKSY